MSGSRVFRRKDLSDTSRLEFPPTPMHVSVPALFTETRPLYYDRRGASFPFY